MRQDLTHQLHQRIKDLRQALSIVVAHEVTTAIHTRIDTLQHYINDLQTNRIPAEIREEFFKLSYPQSVAMSELLQNSHDTIISKLKQTQSVFAKVDSLQLAALLTHNTSLQEQYGGRVFYINCRQLSLESNILFLALDLGAIPQESILGAIPQESIQSKLSTISIKRRIVNVVRKLEQPLLLIVDGIKTNTDLSLIDFGAGMQVTFCLLAHPDVMLPKLNTFQVTEVMVSSHQTINTPSRITLSENERIALITMSMLPPLPDTFTERAAKSLIHDEGILASLIQKNHLMKLGNGYHNEQRYTLTQSVIEHIEPASPSQDVADNLAGYFTDLIATDEVDAIEIYLYESGNIYMAFTHASVEIAVELLIAYAKLLIDIGHYQLILDLITQRQSDWSSLQTTSMIQLRLIETLAQAYFENMTQAEQALNAATNIASTVENLDVALKFELEVYKARLQAITEELDNAREMYNHALLLYNTHREVIAVERGVQLLTNLGQIEMRMADRKETDYLEHSRNAEDYYQQAIILALESDMAEAAIIPYRELGLLLNPPPELTKELHSFMNVQLSFYYMKRGLEIAKRFRRFREAVEIQEQMSINYINAGDIEQARQCFNQQHDLLNGVYGFDADSWSTYHVQYYALEAQIYAEEKRFIDAEHKLLTLMNREHTIYPISAENLRYIFQIITDICHKRAGLNESGMSHDIFDSMRSRMKNTFEGEGLERALGELQNLKDTCQSHR